MVGVIRFFVIFTQSEFLGWVETWEQKEQKHTRRHKNKENDKFEGCHLEEGTTEQPYVLHPT